MPEKKLVIESDEDNKRFYFDTKINGKRIQTVAMLWCDERRKRKSTN